MSDEFLLTDAEIERMRESRRRDPLHAINIRELLLHGYGCTCGWQAVKRDRIPGCSGDWCISCSAAEEIERLRSLITAWADADADIDWFDAPEPWKSDTAQKYTDAVMALRKEVGR